jgi:hypothetical protein
MLSTNNRQLGEGLCLRRQENPVEAADVVGSGLAGEIVRVRERGEIGQDEPAAGAEVGGVLNLVIVIGPRGVRELVAAITEKAA